MFTTKKTTNQPLFHLFIRPLSFWRKLISILFGWLTVNFNICMVN